MLEAWKLTKNFVLQLSLVRCGSVKWGCLDGLLQKFTPSRKFECFTQGRHGSKRLLLRGQVRCCIFGHLCAGWLASIPVVFCLLRRSSGTRCELGRTRVYSNYNPVFADPATAGCPRYGFSWHCSWIPTPHVHHISKCSSTTITPNTAKMSFCCRTGPAGQQKVRTSRGSWIQTCMELLCWRAPSLHRGRPRAGSTSTALGPRSQHRSRGLQPGHPRDPARPRARKRPHPSFHSLQPWALSLVEGEGVRVTSANNLLQLLRDMAKPTRNAS